ncbi:unnamed protein product [marine sediment metagenome]|uniref:Uncharacterized protein n=1 Tax=marine sediment metagenome TaxID=412755 RepID=X0XW20_9ZZZZ
MPPGTDVPGWTPAAVGALAVNPALALVGEGIDDEAMLPLNEKVYTRIGAGIAGAMDMRPVEVNVTLNIDHLTADDPRQIGKLSEVLGRSIGFRLRGLGLEVS